MAENPQSPSDRNILEKSSLYQEFLAEREEILRHKWLESEKQQRDIGFERALLDWIRNHRDAWRANRRRPGSEDLAADRLGRNGAPKTSNP